MVQWVFTQNSFTVLSHKPCTNSSLLNSTLKFLFFSRSNGPNYDNHTFIESGNKWFTVSVSNYFISSTYSWPSSSVGSLSSDSTNCQSKIFRKKKNSSKFQTSKTWICRKQETSYVAFTLFRHYKWSTNDYRAGLLCRTGGTNTTL